MSYQLIQTLQKEAVSIQHACRLLQVSRSGYYTAQDRRLQKVVACTETAQLKACFADSGQSYGSRRLRTALRAKGIVMGRYRVRRLMREHALRPVWKRKFVSTQIKSV